MTLTKQSPPTNVITVLAAEAASCQLRVERIACLGFHPAFELSDDVQEMLEDVAQLIKDDAVNSADVPDEEADADDLSEALLEAGYRGFFVRCANPKSDSWGLYNVRWFYADTIESAIAAGIEWARERESRKQTEGIY